MRFYGVVFAAVAAVVILGLCVGCSADVTDSDVAGKVAEPLSSGQIVTEQLNFPAGVAARSVALGASNSLVLADSVEVLPVNGTLPLVTNTGSTVFNLGANAR